MKAKKETTHREPRDPLQFEKELLAQGLIRIAGVDEVGRGCLAGPVFAAAVIFPPHLKISGLKDSKLLTPQSRETFFDQIQASALAWSVASVDSEEIDRINIHHASLLAMRRAVENLSVSPEYVLVDGKFPLPFSFSQRAIISGDLLSHSIAGASVLAKVSRDRWISEMGKNYPQFQFKKHKGYATAEHRAEILKNGLTPLHRRSFCQHDLYLRISDF